MGSRQGKIRRVSIIKVIRIVLETMTKEQSDIAEEYGAEQVVFPLPGTVGSRVAPSTFPIDNNSMKSIGAIKGFEV